MIESFVLEEGKEDEESAAHGGVEDEESATHGGLALPINFAPPGTEPALAVIDKRGDVIAVSTRLSGLTIAAQRNPFGIAETYEQAEPVTRTGAIFLHPPELRCVLCGDDIFSCFKVHKCWSSMILCLESCPFLMHHTSVY